MTPTRLFCAAASVGGGLLMAACSALDATSDTIVSRLTPYRIEVVQGNFVSKEMAEQVQPGMNRAQVRDILGSPLLADVFHADRWDYVFSIRRPGAELQLRKVTAFFEADRLARLQADALPSEREFITQIDTFKTDRRSPPLQLTEEQLKALPAPREQAGGVERADTAAVQATAAPNRSYPPLEAAEPLSR